MADHGSIAIIPMLPPGTIPDWQVVVQATVAVILVLGPLAFVRTRALQDGSSAIVGRHFKLSHLLPAFIQLCIFTYWGMYYRRLAYYVPLIGLEVLFALVLDALLALSIRGRWRINAGPFPVVFSTNLFVLFLPGQAYLTVAAIGLALVSKAVIVRSNGRHIMNPSAFGISVVGLATLIWPALGYGDTAREFNLAPNMAEVVILLGLIVQTRVPVVLATLGCLFALHGWQMVVGQLIFSPYWAPVTLVIILLVTDPATVPKSQLGRLLYGVAAGILMEIFAALTTWAFAQDFYAKVLCIPFANAAVPWIEALARRLPEPKLLATRFNLAHVAVWLAIVASQILSWAKVPEFELTNEHSTLHARNRTPFIRYNDAGKLTCANNPLFCEGFTFIREVACWRDDAACVAPGKRVPPPVERR